MCQFSHQIRSLHINNNLQFANINHNFTLVCKSSTTVCAIYLNSNNKYLLCVKAAQHFTENVSILPQMKLTTALYGNFHHCRCGWGLNIENREWFDHRAVVAAALAAAAAAWQPRARPPPPPRAPPPTPPPTPRARPRCHSLAATLATSATTAHSSDHPFMPMLWFRQLQLSFSTPAHCTLLGNNTEQNA